MTLTPEQIEEIAERERKAVPGPWWVERIDSITPWTDALSIACCDEVGGSAHVAHTTRGWEGDGTECDSSAQGNAAFIAHARTDIPALLASHRELQAKNDQLSTEVVNLAIDKELMRNEFDDWRDVVKKEVREQQERVEALEKALDQIASLMHGLPRGKTADHVERICREASRLLTTKGE